MSDSRTVTFHARSVVLKHPQNLCYLLGLADHPESPERYLLLQRDFEHLEGVEEAPSYYLEWCGPNGGGWGGVDAVAQTAGRLELEFDEAVGQLLGLRQLIITFDAGVVDDAILATRLRSIFQGCDTRLALAGEQ